MKKNMHNYAYLQQGIDTRSLYVYFTISLVCHLVFFAVFIFVPGYTTHRKYSPGVVNVSLVSFSSPKASSGPRNVLEPDTRAFKQKKAGVKKAAFATGAKKKKKLKKSLKKKTFKSSKVVKSALARIEKRVEESQPDPVAAAISRIKKKVDKSEKSGDRKHKYEKNTFGHGTGTEPAASGSGKRTLEKIDIYRHEIAYRIQKNWAFSEQLASGKGALQASLVFKVMPNGEISGLFFTDRSGNSYLDDSAYKAVMKSNPVDPHPRGISKPFIEIGLRFGPSGVE